MRVGIVGSRSIRDTEAVIEAIRACPFPISAVVTGDALGVDMLAAQWATMHTLPLTIEVAEWSKHGPKAGPMRNARLVEKIDALYAIWDGKSKGTADTIRKARAKQLPLHVHLLRVNSPESTPDPRTSGHVWRGTNAALFADLDDQK